MRGLEEASATCYAAAAHFLPCVVSYSHPTTNRLMYKLLHKRHVPPHVEVAVVLAGAYTVYLCTGW